MGNCFANAGKWHGFYAEEERWLAALRCRGVRGCLLLSLLLLLLCSCSGAYEARTESALRCLDDSLARRSRIEARKDGEILRLKQLEHNALSPSEKYHILDRLFEAYRFYNIDSTLHCVRAKFGIAMDIGDRELIDDARLDMIDVDAVSGMYVQALRELEKMDTSQLSPAGRKHYFSVSVNLYESMSNVYRAHAEVADYRSRLKHSRERLLELTAPESAEALFLRVSLALDASGKSGLLIREMERRLQSDSALSVHDRAILSYLLSHAYRKEGNETAALYFLVRSAVYDVSTPVREHKSLYELSAMLYGRGDTERAYRYVDASLTDLQKTKVRAQMQSVEELIPSVISAYNAKKEKDHGLLLACLALVSIGLVLLVAALLFVQKEKRKAQEARKKEVQTNRMLNATNEKLERLNRRLAESDSVKEAYIGQYVDMSSSYIDRMEKYRSGLLNLQRTKGLKEVAEALKSSTFIGNELADFYREFDRSFLHIYPNFVEEFNALLREECRFDVLPGKPLNTELRVFALIRLGITDSVKIAAFLRRSVSTIYNYRVKMRNAALAERDNFESQVQKIGNLRD